MASKDEYKELAIPLPPKWKWDQLNNAGKNAAMDHVKEHGDEILSICPGVKNSVEHVTSGERATRHSQGNAIDDIRGALWIAFYGKPGRCKGVK